MRKKIKCNVIIALSALRREAEVDLAQRDCGVPLGSDFAKIDTAVAFG